MRNIGWNCPRCGRSYSPEVKECYWCNKDVEQMEENKELAPESKNISEKSKVDSEEYSDEELHAKIEHLKQMIMENIEFDDEEDEDVEIVFLVDKSIVGKLEEDLKRIILEG